MPSLGAPRGHARYEAIILDRTTTFNFTLLTVGVAFSDVIVEEHSREGLESILKV